MDFNFNVSNYNLFIETKEHIEEYIVGFKSNSNVIYRRPDYLDKGKQGISEIEFDLDEDSSSIKSLLKISERRYLFEITIVDGNDNTEIEIKGLSFKMIHSNDNKKWIIRDFYAQIENKGSL